MRRAADVPQPRPRGSLGVLNSRIAPGDLFVYGSLTVDEVLRAVLDRVPSRRPARAVGWRAAALRGLSYPGLVAADSTADGAVLTDLTARERTILDAFEGPPYQVRQVALHDGGAAAAYVWVDASLAEPFDWDREAFQRNALPAFLEECAHWRSTSGW